MKFHDIPYQRINLDVMKKQADAIHRRSEKF